MLDIFNLPNTDNNTQVFYSNSNSWQSWYKPRNCMFVHLYVIGSGGGGSGGTSGASNTTRRGGSGGGSSAISTGIFPSIFLPDTLFIQVGSGGAGGGAGLKGGDGQLSYVNVEPDYLIGNIVLASGAIAASGGTAGGAAAGAASTIFLKTGGLISYYGTCFLNAGVAGNTGGSAAVGLSLNIVLPVSGGAGGGGCGSGTNFDGGQINGAGIFPTLLGSVAGGTTTASNGFASIIPSSNISTSRPLLFMGGSGGGGVFGGTGSVGGNGSYGCGGGGGGAGVTGGAGGRGGDGIVIITAW